MPAGCIRIISYLKLWYADRLRASRKPTIIARRDGVDYVECLDCRQIFEAEDLEPVTVEADEE